MAAGAAQLAAIAGAVCAAPGAQGISGALGAVSAVAGASPAVISSISSAARCGQPRPSFRAFRAEPATGSPIRHFERSPRPSFRAKPAAAGGVEKSRIRDPSAPAASARDDGSRDNGITDNGITGSRDNGMTDNGMTGKMRAARAARVARGDGEHEDPPPVGIERVDREAGSRQNGRNDDGERSFQSR